MSTLARRASLLIALVILGGVLAPGAAAPPGKGLPSPLAVNVPLAKEQLKLIDQISADMDRLYRGGELSATDPGFILWSQRRLDALRASGATRAEMIAALGDHLKRARQHEAWTKQKYKDAEVSRMDVAAAEYGRLQAEMRLNEEKASQ